MNVNGAQKGAPLPRHRMHPQIMSAPPPMLHAKTSKPATAFFLLYIAALIAYFVIRCVDIARVLTNWTERGYSIAVLVVEAIGVSALVPYALANLRPTLPIMESEKDAPRNWKEFGCDQFDVFILVPCYKESWATIKRTLMCAMFARVPPGCRKHIVLGNDGHDVVSAARCRLPAVCLPVL
eukprot:GHRQ01031741.1.p1 GENE.GHRQ01031741.1~~GHRQ01031741.1.p1  ORF type:complete len:181 (+),score=43.74 GHRQ01031741.1:849-1391(+)